MARGDADIRYRGRRPDNGLAVTEVEAMTSAHPPLGEDRWPAFVEAICGLYRRFGYELRLVADTVESNGDLRGVVGAIGADEHVVARLKADPSRCAAASSSASPKGWADLDRLVAASARLGRVIAGLDGIAFASSTEGQRPEVVAERIRDAIRAALGAEHR